MRYEFTVSAECEDTPLSAVKAPSLFAGLLQHTTAHGFPNVDKAKGKSNTNNNIRKH